MADNIITYTSDADSIDNTLNGVTINAGKGDDTVNNSGENVSVFGGDGYDLIANDSLGTGSTLEGGKGDDSIDNAATIVTIVGGAGDDSITNSGEEVSIVGSGGGDSITNSGALATINSGTDNDYVNNTGASVLINGGAGNDSVINWSTNSSLVGGDGNDSILNEKGSDNSKILGGAGNDTINNFGAKHVTIDGGAGNDSIYNHWHYGAGSTGDQNYYCDYGSINGNSEDDIITNSDGRYVTINGDDGADFIANTGASVTIDAGAGNDTLSLGNGSVTAANNVILYYEGEGNDLIQGFRTDSRLRIDDGDGEFATLASDDDIIVAVGSNRITLEGAASLESVNIEGEEVIADIPVWTLKDNAATYGTADETLITVSGVKSLDGLALKGTTVTIGTNALGSERVTISDGYTLALGNDVSAPSTTAANWSFSGTTATYKAAATTAGYTLDNNQIS